MKAGVHSLRCMGLTIVEVTLVIAVLLGLVSVVFIGISAFRRGADRAQCVMNISKVQKAMRSYQNLYTMEVGDAILINDLAGEGKPLSNMPECPSAIGVYSFATEIPERGVTYATCSLSSTRSHVPEATAGW